MGFTVHEKWLAMRRFRVFGGEYRQTGPPPPRRDAKK